MRAHFVLSSVFVLSLSFFSSGCFGNKGGGDDYDPTLVPAPLEYELGMPGLSWNEADLTPVTDVAFDPVSFGYDSYQIASSETARIEEVGNYMLGNREVRLIVQGHCDERGSREYNLSLGEHRALAVRAYLVSLGVPADSIQTRSFGEEQPVDPGHSEAAWRLNRRGEFALYR